MRYQDFRRILVNISSLLDDQPGPSAHKTNRDGPRPVDDDGSPETETWWLAKRVGTDPGKPRTQAYLTAYVAVCGNRIPAAGIRLDDGWVWPDRDVMKCLLQAGLIDFTPGMNAGFELTSRGLDYLRASSRNFRGENEL